MRLIFLLKRNEQKVSPLVAIAFFARLFNLVLCDTILNGEKGARMLRLSMNELTTMRWSFERDVTEFAAASYEGIGVWRQKLSDIGEDRGTDLLREHGLQVSNLLWAGGFTGSDGRSYRESIQDAIEGIRTAARLDAECLVLYSGARGGHTRGHARRLVKNALIELVPHAEEFGVTLAMEPMHPGCGAEWTFLTTLEETLSLIDPLESPYLKLVLDTYHYAWERPSLASLADVANRIAIVHLGDGERCPCGEQNRCPLGQGQVPLRDIVSTLARAGYDGFLDVELFGEAVESIDYRVLLSDSRDVLLEMVATRS